MNTLITQGFVSKDVALNYKNNVKLVGQFDRSYDSAYASNNQGKVGATISARLQQRWVVNEGQALITQPILNQTVPITANHQYQVGMAWSSADDALAIEEVQDRLTKPAGQALANKDDLIAGAEVHKTVYYSIGSYGTAITDNQTYLNGVAKMRNVAVPQDLVVVLDPLAQGKLLGANQALFNPQQWVGKLTKSGMFSGPALGADSWSWDPNMPTFTCGTFTTATPVVSGASQTGSSLALSGMGTYAMVAGDSFTLAGVNSVNPVSYNDTGDLQQFTLVSNLSGTTTGTFIISPPIITSGPLQTVTASPANSAVVTWLGATGTVAATMTATTSKTSFMFNPAAFAHVAVDLPATLPGAKAKRITDPDSAVSLRLVEQYNIQTDQLPTRIDMLVGIASILPSMALRIFS